MSDKLKILHLEDNKFDAELINEVLERHAFDVSVTIVDNREGFINALESNSFDLVFSDYSVPGFSGSEALIIARQKCPDIPFIFISGTIGEERAVQTLLEGANDYILKERPERLLSVVRKLAEQINNRKQISELKNVITAISGSINDVIYIIYRDEKKLKWLSSMKTLFGFSENSFETDNLWWEERLHPDDRQTVLSDYRSAMESQSVSFSCEYRFRKADDTYIFVADKMFIERNSSGVPVRIFGSISDISERKNLEKLLMWESQFYKNLLEDANIWIHVLDMKGNLIIWNKKAVEMSGYSKDELFGSGNGWDILTHGGYAGLKKIFWDLIEKNESLRDYEQRIYTKDGRELLFRWSSGFVTNHKNEKVAILFLGKDITAEKAALKGLERSEKYYRALIESSSDYILVCDSSGRIKYSSVSIERKLGIKAENLIGKIIYRLFPICDYEKVESFFQNFVKQGLEYASIVIELIRPMSGQVFLEIKVYNMTKDPDIAGIIVNARDITERKNFEKQLIAARDQAEEMNKLKSSFFSNMSHELRTPLIGIMGFAEILADYDKDKEVKRMAERILISSSRLNHTLNMILDLRKLESSEIKSYYSVTDIAGLLKRIREDFTPEAEQKGLEIRLNVKEGLLINTDQELIMKALINLVSNAVKYTNRGVVELGAVHSAGNMIIYVKDTGIGIPKENLHNIFMPFKQVSEGYGRGYEGAGLGLAITKKIAELLKGDLSVESELNQGSVFSLSIPLTDTNDL